MDVSIAVLGKNSAWILKYSLLSIERAIRRLGAEVEVLYIDGGSTDGSPELVKKIIPQARVIDAAGTNIPEARNVAVKESRGEAVVFWDSDILAPPNAVKALIVQDRPIASLNRKDVYVREESEIKRLLDAVGEEDAYDVNEVPFVVFSVTMIRREVFEKVGLFDERMTQAEDRDFGLRARCRGFKSYLLTLTAYDINRKRISDVPVATPLRQYLRGIAKKALIYSYTASPRQRKNSALYAVLHSMALAGAFLQPLLAVAELAPLAYHLAKYGGAKGLEMYLKSVIFYTLMALATPLKIRDICKWL